ncbi:flagellar motor switch protein FliN [Thalassotalea sp. PLHSN55]|uniref:flagellar motor switch protein FliN n=1 Tax=Thalassotalea sp. PLHSN55 TaxID=3435888 RepID=UPI003F8329E1
MNDFNVDNLDLNVDELDGLDDIEVTEPQEKPAPKRDLSFFHNIPVDVTLEVASTKLVLGDLMELTSGAVIELDKLADEALDVKVNGQLLASAEVVVVNGKYGIKLIDIVDDVLTGFTQ